MTPLLGFFKEVEGEKRDRRPQASSQSTPLGLPAADGSPYRSLQALQVQSPNIRELILMPEAGQSNLTI